MEDKRRGIYLDGVTKGFLEELTSGLRPEGGARQWKMWRKSFQAERTQQSQRSRWGPSLENGVLTKGQ